MKIILDSIKKESEFKSLISSVNEKNAQKAPIIVSGLCEGARSAFLAALVEELESKKPALIIVHDEKSCARLAESLRVYGINPATYLPRDFV